MLDIKILGSGCANCQRLEAIARACLEELKLEGTVEKVTDYAQILSYNVMSTPGLVINGRVVSSGRLPAPGSVTAWLKEAEGQP